MKKIFTILFLSIVLLILDNAFMPFIAIKGVYPNLLFVFIVCYSILNGSWSGIFVGVLAGVLQDVYLMGNLGINMLINMLACLISAQVGKAIFKDKSIIPIIACFFISVFKGIFMFIIFYIIGKHVNIKIVFYESIYNMIISIVMYRLIYKLCQKDFMVKNWRF